MDLSVIGDNLRYLLLGAWPDGPLGGAALTVVLSAASALAAGALGLLAGIALSLPAPAYPRRGVRVAWLAVAGALLALVSTGWWMRWFAPALLGPLAAFMLLALAAGLARLRAVLPVMLGLLRAVPILLLIFWIYFLLPVLFGIDVPGVATVAVVLSLVGGAYLSHAVHAGILSLPRGQWQAAQALGLGRWQAMRQVVLPQALPVMVPSFVNQWVALIKDSSLAYVIGVGELSFVATQVNSRLMVHPLEIFAFVALVYFVLCTALELLANRAARRWQRQGGAAA